MSPLKIAFVVALAAATQALAQPQAGAPRPNAFVEFPAKGGTHLTVTTPGWKDGGDISFEYTQYRTNTFPGLSWTSGPPATQSYAVILQDTDLSIRGAPVLHWVLYNIPKTVTKLEPGMAPTGNPPGSAYGPNYQGSARPYLGPRTPPGPKHHYHFQVFALDRMLAADPAITYDGLVSQMKDHILASGEIVGLGQADPNAPPPPPRPAAK
ncbi:MAG TPA: YbhB/YbcL family Raf kinase inhibitor-like protein [Caulobacteraceae bacterium]|nr:YbhB/YbcL family Raf kinase inhibitor-like protein [Caulobacteraceae bacterium]